ncbi:MAG: sulfur carrier protein ThiS [Leptospirillia bacterium]
MNIEAKGGSASMEIVVNGERRTVGEALTLQELVREMGFLEKPVVCEVNLSIVSRKDWAETVLSPEDTVEVIGFVGGG